MTAAELEEHKREREHQEKIRRWEHKAEWEVGKKEPAVFTAGFFCTVHTGDGCKKPPAVLAKRGRAGGMGSHTPERASYGHLLRVVQREVTDSSRKTRSSS